MQIFLIAAPAEERACSRRGCLTAHAAYHIGPDSTLLRRNLPLQGQGGLLCISDQDAPPVRDPETLCAAAERECSRRGYSGAVLDFEDTPREDLQAFADLLSRRFRQRGLSLYLPEPYCESTSAPIRLIGTALSGGNLREHLQEAVQAYGAAQLALDAERLRMEFPLPCPNGIGKPLTGAELATLLEQEQPTVFFSPDLCARYFTYSRDGQHRFVLFDDAGTLREKLRIGESLGIPAAFLTWPEIADIAEALLLQTR